MDEDFLERAEALTNYQISAAIEAARRTEAAPSNFDGTCDCGKSIHIRRVELGYHRCLECQERLEKRRH